MSQALNVKTLLSISNDIEESKGWLNLEKDGSTYKRDLAKRITREVLEFPVS